MKTHRSERRREKHKARIKFLKIQNLTIEPQRSKYEFEDTRPTRIGDIAYIRLARLHPDYGWLASVMPTKVILLADESGRRWLVQCA